MVGDRLRLLDDDKVAELAKSMQAIGLINPIMLAPPDGQGGGPRLIAGRHRFEAAKRLGWETIAYVLAKDKSEDELKLIEVDENLIRAELSPAERATNSKVRKEIYERLFPETKHGAAPGAGRGKGSKPVESRQFGDRFTRDTAAKSGRSERAVQRDVQRADDIPQIADVVGTSLDKGEELDALAKLEPEEQTDLISKAKAGEAVSARAFDRTQRELAPPDTAGNGSMGRTFIHPKTGEPTGMNTANIGGRRDHSEPIGAGPVAVAGQTGESKFEQIMLWLPELSDAERAQLREALGRGPEIAA